MSLCWLVMDQQPVQGVSQLSSNDWRLTPAPPTTVHGEVGVDVGIITIKIKFINSYYNKNDIFSAFQLGNDKQR